MPTDLLDVHSFGASGDGRRDDTAAIQKAIDAAAEIQGTVLFPPARYRCSTVRLRSHVGLLGQPTWSYRDFAGAVLQLADGNAQCLLDVTGAVGVTINGLCLDGNELRDQAHGIMVDKPDYGQEEDVVRIERCRTGRFSADGIHLGRIWCFSIRHCMVAFNRGCGVWVRGWDGFLLDNWLSGNRGAGYGAFEENAAVTMTANRIEWNAGGGIIIHDGNHYSICNNYLDRSGGPGVAILPKADWWGQVFSITGNLINRSGKPDWRPLSRYESAHVVFDGVRGLAFSNDTMNAGRDDAGKGEWSPRHGIVYGRLRDSIVQGNAMHNGALEQLIVDQGGHGDNVIVRDNPGSLLRPA